MGTYSLTCTMGTCRSICCIDLETVKLLFVGAVTQICVTLWGHGGLLAFWEHADQFDQFNQVTLSLCEIHVAQKKMI